MRTVVSGGGGLLGSDLCEALLTRGAEVVCRDDWSTGSPSNVAHLGGWPGFVVVEADMSDAAAVTAAMPAWPVDAVAHLASPHLASPASLGRAA